MRVFLSYASEDRAVAQSILLALRADGHDVFFDREDLPPGESFHTRIRLGIERSDLFVFLVSPQAFDAGSYTINELGIAEQRWKSPSGRVLPVVLRPMNIRELPPYLRAVTLLEPQGDVPAAVAEAVRRMAATHHGRRVRQAVVGAAVAASVAAIAYLGLRVGQAPADSAPQALVPAGAFTMGDGEQLPQRELYLDAFYIDKLETTTARYAKFLEATGSVSTPDLWDEVQPATDGELPVVGVTWRDADEYCRWAGKRLPTEAEWEKAARGAGARTYPWGEESPTIERANYENSSPDAYDGGLAAVGTHPTGASEYGVEDLAGNAAEWVADWWTESFDVGDVRNPRGPKDGEAKVVRGGGRYDPAAGITATRRYYASRDTVGDDIGFRCASDP